MSREPVVWNMRSASRRRIIGVAIAALLLAAACSSGGEAGSSTTALLSTSTSVGASDATTVVPATTDAPPATESFHPPLSDESTVTGPIESANPIIQPQPALAVPDGYTEEEFFVEGEATSFGTAGGSLDGDGKWSVEPAGLQQFKTRVIVRRPPTERFSGVVVVEWLNVSAVEAAPDWAYLSEEIARAGHAYVAVSAQALGVIGGESLLSVEVDDESASEVGAEPVDTDGGGLINNDPERYGSLAHPGDAYAFDIFRLVGAAVKHSPELLGGLEPTIVIAAGESQSAGFLTTYVNAIHFAAEESAFDAYLVHSRGAGAVPIGGSFGDDTSFVDDGVMIRDDLDVPVFIVESETDLTLLGYSLARQPDTDLIRTWEVAGTAHADAHTFRAIFGGPRDPNQGSFIGCDRPINAGPHHEAVSAALHHLVAWASDGDLPPTAERLAIVGDGDVAIDRDELGIALGGVRNPLVDVPVAVYSGDPYDTVSTTTEGFDICNLFGQTTDIDAATLATLYGSADAYVEAFTEATAVAVDGGYLLPADAEQLLEEAEENRSLFG